MYQFFATRCGEISHFDSVNGLPIRAVLKSDTEATDVFQVWLLPEKDEAFTADSLKLMGFKSFKELSDCFDPDHCLVWRGCTAYKKQHDLLNAFAPDLDLDRAHFYYTPHLSPSGLVVLVVFGTERNMLAFKEADTDLEPFE